jgi:hypothetical protein
MTHPATLPTRRQRLGATLAPYAGAATACALLLHIVIALVDEGRLVRQPGGHLAGPLVGEVWLVALGLTGLSLLAAPARRSTWLSLAGACLGTLLFWLP